MKKKISRFLLKLARRIDRSVVFEDIPTARELGLCIHIAKNDVRSFRKEHPEVKSHREGLRLLVEEAKWQVAGAIGRAFVKKGIIDYDVKKTNLVADVTGTVFIYGGEEKESAGN